MKVFYGNLLPMDCLRAGLLLTVTLVGTAFTMGGCGGAKAAKETPSNATLGLVEEAKHEKPPADKHYNEAPMLAEQVKAGKLPPVWKRLPENPMVVPVYEEIGQYGGTWRRMMKGISDVHAYTRINYENMLRWAPNPNDGVIPNLAEKYEFENNCKLLRLHLRKGLKWSDGYPFTTDDIVFWWERIANDKNLTPAVPKV